MTSRISKDSLIKAYDTGYRSFNWMSRLAKKHIDLVSDVNLEALLEGKDAKKKVQAVEPLKIYRALMANGPSESLEVLQLLSDEQVTRIMDYDSWNEGALAPKKAFQWLALYADISKKELYTRFKSLEEEYQLALLSPFIRVFDPEEYENMSDAEQDALFSFPGNAAYYKVLTEDPVVEKFIHDLLDATMEENMEYALSLVAHASYLPPNENEQAITQFRNARNEEDGFIPYEEAVTAFYPLKNFKEMASKWNAVNVSSTKEGLVQNSAVSQHFMMLVLEEGTKSVWDSKQAKEISDSFIYLANQLASVVGVEPGELEDLKRVLEQAYAVCGFSLQLLSKDDPEFAAKILAAEYPKAIFRFGVSQIHSLRLDVLDELERMGVENLSQLKANVVAGKFGLCLDWLDKELIEKYGVLFVEILKGLFNRFTLAPKALNFSSIQEAERIEFVALDSVELFEGLKLEVASLTQLAKLAKAANAEVNGNIEKVLTKAIASVLSGGKFINFMVSDKHVDALVSATREDLEESLNNLIASIPDIIGSEEVGLKFSRNNLGKTDLSNKVSSYLMTYAMNLMAALESSKGDASALRQYIENL